MCGKTIDKTQAELSVDQVNSLLRLLKRNHVDICKVLNSFDPNKSGEFRKRNQAYMRKEHKHEGQGCCSV